MDVIKNENPALNVNAYVPRNAIENLAVNLYSDKYFVPFRGKSFSGLSEKARTKDWRKIQSCYIKSGGQKDSYTAWVFNNLIYNYYIDFRSDAFKRKVIERNELRKAMNMRVERITSGASNYEAIQQFKAALKSKYAVLFPSEQQKAMNLITNAESDAADNLLLNETNVLSNFPNNNSTIATILDFKLKNQELIAKASGNTKTRVNQILDAKLNEVLVYLMHKEELKLEGIKTTDANTKDINRLLADFKEEYKEVLNLKPVNKTLQLFKTRKTEIVANMESYLSEGLKNIQSQGELVNLETIFLKDLDINSNVYKRLKSQLDQRRQDLINRNNKILAQKKIESEKAQKAFEQEMARRNTIITQMKREVMSLRARLNSKYGTSLPTYEDLHYLLSAHLALFDINDKYKKADANNFIKLAQDKGFYRVKNGNMSNLERFRDKNGFEIKCFLSDDTGKGIVQLIVPNQTKELVELYRKELLSSFRDRLKPLRNPEVEDEYSNTYINSGRSLYSYSDGQKYLYVKVRSNIDATLTIVAEQESATTYKLGPFTNYTNLMLKNGQEYTVKVGGQMKLGNFLGKSGPLGIKGYRVYNVDSRFPHGSVIGKVGENGEWFLVGSGGTFVSTANGRLYLRVNDKRVNDNDGYYTFQYELK